MTANTCGAGRATWFLRSRAPAPSSPPSLKACSGPWIGLMFVCLVRQAYRHRLLGVHGNDLEGKAHISAAGAIRSQHFFDHLTHGAAVLTHAADHNPGLCNSTLESLRHQRIAAIQHKQMVRGKEHGSPAAIAVASAVYIPVQTIEPTLPSESGANVKVVSPSGMVPPG